MRIQLDNEIDSMISMDIIEKSTAAYASPVVMIKNIITVYVCVAIIVN